ncbi:hypothetical protein [Bacillus thuringiensis]|nr:hypothetical protein [Bacillus thuringiensis]MEC3068071.1 hypothetical protein [Bacillus cereus]HDR7922194.1 hypothetical protein [Bacillus paranthracis]MBN6708078.1 hypothetical protein [Bacillus thuringiensis]MDV6355224.1 hypothetical protein [Bacillus thuringiensis]MEC3093216.1 hypothetical protein [Bacillus cereus]
MNTMQLTKDELLKKVDELALKNFKVRALLQHNGSFDNIPDYQQKLILDAIGVKKQDILTN